MLKDDNSSLLFSTIEVAVDPANGTPKPKEGTLSKGSGSSPQMDDGAQLYHLGNKGKNAKEVGLFRSNTAGNANDASTAADAFTLLATEGAFGTVPVLSLNGRDIAATKDGEEAGTDHPMPVEQSDWKSLVAKAPTPRTIPLGGEVHYK
jgi:hypothetical protein